MNLKYHIYLKLIDLTKLVSMMGVKLNLPILTALSWFLLLRKYKKINYTSNANSRKVIILEKSFGIEDIYASFNGEKSKIKFFYLPRIHISVIYDFFLSKYNLRENTYNLNFNSKIVHEKKKCEIYFVKTIRILKKFFNFKGIISFNFKYHRERELHKAVISNGLKFLSCHKESLLTETDIISYQKILEKGIGRYNGSFITVYNRLLYKLIIKSSITNKKNIEVIGMPRLDQLYKADKKKLKQNYILILLIDIYKGWSLIDEAQRILKKKIIKTDKKKVNWSKLSDDILLSTLELAKSEPSQRFIFKTKVENFYGTKISLEKLKNNLPTNCSIVTKGSGIDLIKNASIVVGFNTTGILESVVLNKPTIVPLINIRGKEILKRVLKLSNKIHYYPRSKLEYKETIKKLLNKSNKIKKYYPKEKDLINYYLGNVKGNSGQKLRNVIYKIF